MDFENQTHNDMMEEVNNMNSMDTIDSASSSDFTLDDIYFKDAFTKTGDKLNLEVNNASIDCITSNKNTFSLDENGNLTVKTITAESITTDKENNQYDKQTICNMIYPVGSVFLSMSNTNPSVLFGGTWSQINGYYLYAGTGGNTGGSNTSGTPSNNNTSSTAITIAQMPAHTHTQNAHNHAQNRLTQMNDSAHYDTRPAGTTGYYMGADLATYYTESTTATNNNTGGGQGHTHTLNNHTHSVNPLRYELYAWRRTA